MKINQVLRTRVPIKTAGGIPVPVKTRVVVSSIRRVTEKAGKDVVKVKVSDPNAGGAVAGQWFTAAPGAFNKTHAGRPKLK